MLTIYSCHVVSVVCDAVEKVCGVEDLNCYILTIETSLAFSNAEYASQVHHLSNFVVPCGVHTSPPKINLASSPSYTTGMISSTRMFHHQKVVTFQSVSLGKNLPVVLVL